MATLVTKTIGPSGDYKSLAEFEALNLNLVALDQYYEVTIANNFITMGGVNFNGWTTDSTRYIHIKGGGARSTNTSARRRNPGYGQSQIVCGNSNIGPSVGETITIGGIGNGGLIIFEDVVLVNSVSGYRCINITQATACIVRCKNCLLISRGGAASMAVSISSSAVTEFQAINSTLIAMGTCVNVATGLAMLYNCTIRSTGGIAVEANSKACVFFNCYAVRGAAANAFSNIGASTITTCASSDATTPTVALRNITLDHTEVKSFARWFGDFDLVSTSQLIAQGTTLVGLPAPYNYTDDIKGRARVLATPDVGSTQYDATESPVLIERQLHNTEGDYASLQALAATNLDLVAANVRLTVHQQIGWSDATAAVNFATWNTDSTRYLHVKTEAWDGIERGHAGTEQDVLSTNYAAYLSAASAGAALITIGGIGVNGLIIFEGMQIGTTSNAAGTKTISVSEPNAGAVVRFDRCRLYATGNGSNIVAVTEAAAGCTLQLINCYTRAAGTGNPNTISRLGGIIKAYHCTFISTGNNSTVVDMGDGVGSHVVNCFCKEQGAGVAYANLTNVTFLTNAATDATGAPAGLDNVTPDDTNFVGGVGGQDWQLRSTSVLLRAGTNLSAYPAPFDVPKDHNNCTRPSARSVGAFDIPGVGYLGWTKNLGLATATHDNIRHTAVGSDGYLYAIAERNAATNPPVVYHLTSPVAAWSAADYTHAVNARGKGMVRYLADDTIYALMGDLLQVAKQGAPWAAVSGNYLGGMPGNPAYNQSDIFSFVGESWLYCPHGNGGGVLARDADGSGTWSDDAFTPRHAGTPSCIFVERFASLGNLFQLHSYGLAAMCVAGTWRECHAFDITSDCGTSGLMWGTNGNYTYFIADDPGSGISGRFIVYRAGADMIFQKVSTFAGIQASPQRCGIVTTGGIYFGVASRAGYVSFLVSPDVGGGVFGESWFCGPTTYLMTASTLYSESGMAQRGSIWEGRIAFGLTRVGAPDTVGIIYSDVFSNSCQYDNLDSYHAQWNQGKYSSTVMLQAQSSSDHPYVRLNLAPKDDSGAIKTFTVRRVRNYYTMPPAYRWKQYRISLDLTTNYLRNKEDGFRWYQRVYKDGQDVWAQAPCCVSGTLIPIAFVHPSEAKTAETLSFSDVGNLNSLLLKFRWTPTFCNTSVEADREFCRIGYDPNNYLVVTMHGSESKEREWDISDRYNVHEPLWSIKRYRGGALEGTQTLNLWYSYPGGTPGADWLLDDTVEFEIVQRSYELWGMTIRVAGLEGYTYNYSSTDPFGSSGPNTLMYSGYGYFSGPTVKNVVSRETHDLRGPARSLPAMREGVVRRLTARKQNPALVGNRDPTVGNISTLGDNPFLQPDSFSRADSPDLGSKWSTDLRTGAGWYIEGSVAKCSGAGIERYTCLPRHRDYGITTLPTISNDGVKCGVFGRYEYDSVPSRGPTCYMTYVTQVGAAAANLIISRWYLGTEYVLSTVPFSSYTAGVPFMLVSFFTGTNRVRADVYQSAAYVAAGNVTDTAVPTVLTKPGRIGIYGVTGGPGEIALLDSWVVTPLFDNDVS